MIAGGEKWLTRREAQGAMLESDSGGEVHEHC